MENKFTGYEITTDGKVYSVDSNWRGYGKREMATELDGYGYKKVRILIGGARKKMHVHRLVLEAHIGPRPTPKHVCRHLDGNKLNNKLSNLRWGTYLENTIDSIRHGSHRNAKKTHCKRGHEFSANNTHTYRGSRNCLRCRKEIHNAKR